MPKIQLGSVTEQLEGNKYSEGVLTYHKRYLGITKE